LCPRDPRGPHGRRLRRAARPRLSRVPGLGPSAKPAGTPRQLGDRSHDRDASTPSAIVMAEADPDKPSALNHDRRAFQLKERMTYARPARGGAADQRIGWALVEDAERAAGSSQPRCCGHDRCRIAPGARGDTRSRTDHAVAEIRGRRQPCQPRSDAREGDERERRPRVNSDDARSTVASRGEASPPAWRRSSPPAAPPAPAREGGCRTIRSANRCVSQSRDNTGLKGVKNVRSSLVTAAFRQRDGPAATQPPTASFVAKQRSRPRCRTP
jgi:hypothetical protein